MENGLRPADAHELLAFGAQHPNEQLKYSAIALGSVWRTCEGRWMVPVLGHRGNKKKSSRLLGIEDFNGVWDQKSRFACVRK